MIPNQWYAILESSEVEPGEPVGVTRMGEKLVFWRDQSGRVACLRDLCAHRGAALSRGKVCAGNVACPFHGFQYDASGACRLIPANGRAAAIPRNYQVQSYPVREAHGFIWLWLGEPGAQLPELPYFEDLTEEFTWATFRDRWSVHYSRAIENQLDVVHLPFVHYNTIGRGGRTVVDGPVVADDERQIEVWVHNRADDGTPARKAEELPPPEGRPILRFRFPNLWQLLIAEDVRICLAFAPIDEGNTLLYARYYQRAVRAPLLRNMVAFAGMLGSIVIIRQDKRVVVTQRPKRSDFGMKERLVPGDRPIWVYRQRRRELIDRAAAPVA